MGIYGVDIHPRFQAGINIEEIRREGFDFMAVKVSEGLDGSYLPAGSAEFLRRGRAAGLLCLGYHYLHAGDEDIQAKVFAEALRATGIPGLLDAEALAADQRTPTLTLDGIRGFLDSCQRLGASVPLLYLPHWYWDRIGRPPLAGLPPLWASSYVSSGVASAPASQMYQSHPASGWDAYGSLGVEVLQFTDRAQVAGQLIDADHYRGTREQFAALIGRPHRRKDHHEMDKLPATAFPADPNSDPRSWPQLNYDVGFDPAGGWEGGFAFSFGVQEWAGRSVDPARGHLALASWIMADRSLTPVDPVFTREGAGQVIFAHNPTHTFGAPEGAVGLTLNYTAPGGAYVTEGRSG
ncbi:MAG: GH25 family lysozyme [Pseudonocardiaceae bacterium]